MKRVPMDFAIIYEIILILASFSFPPLWIYAIINAIPIIIAIGKHQYDNYDDFKDKKLQSVSESKAVQEINKLLYENNKIRLRYTYSKQVPKDKSIAKPYFLQDVCKSIYSKYGIKRFIFKELQNSKNVFHIFNKFSVNYEYEPENLLEYVNILDNEIRFLTFVFELYNIEIVDNSYNFKLKIREEENLKKFWLNYLLFLKMSLNRYLCTVIKISASSESIDNEYLKNIEEQIQSALFFCICNFEELNDSQIEL